MLSKLDETNLYKVLFWDGMVFIAIALFQYFSFATFPIYESHSGLSWFPLSLEFSSDYVQLTNLVGRVGDEALSSNLDILLRVLELDYLFIVIYSIYFLAIFEVASKLSGPPFWLKTMYYILIIIIILLDASQNFFLIEILNSNLGFSKNDWIVLLPKVSLILWNLVFLNLGIIGVLIWLGTYDYYLRFLSLFFFLPPIFSVFSFLGRLTLLEIALQVALVGLVGFYLYSTYRVATKLLFSRNVAE